MIIKAGWLAKCDKCGTSQYFQINSSRSIRNYGWVLCRNNYTCYCPKCKTSKRKTGSKRSPPVTEEKIKFLSPCVQWSQSPFVWRETTLEGNIYENKEKTHNQKEKSKK